MHASNDSPSMAWRDEIFTSGPRRDIARQSKTTTRIPIFVPAQGCQMYAEGGNEATALLLLRHLQLIGVVRRFKAQPFNCVELGGPARRVPDILAELMVDKSLHIIECKPKRFITPEVQERFDLEKSFLMPRGFKFHVWTDRDRLSNPTSQTVRLLDRGFRSPPPHAILDAIESAAAKSTRLGQLIAEFGWDDTIAAAALGHFHIDITKRTYEDTPILHYLPRGYYNFLFESGPVLRDWWDSIAPGRDVQGECGAEECADQ